MIIDFITYCIVWSGCPGFGPPSASHTSRRRVWVQRPTKGVKSSTPQADNTISYLSHGQTIFINFKRTLHPFLKKLGEGKQI